MTIEPIRNDEDLSGIALVTLGVVGLAIK